MSATYRIIEFVCVFVCLCLECQFGASLIIKTRPKSIKKMKNFCFAAPTLTVLDGFGRELVDQYYNVGSSLEIICFVDRLPARPLPEIIEWRHGNRKIKMDQEVEEESQMNSSSSRKSDGDQRYVCLIGTRCI